jgi:alpha-ketoglutarate-dependent taurine dioxygenase
MFTENRMFERFGLMLVSNEGAPLSALSTQQIIGLFRKSGLLLLRGFSCNLELFEAFSSSITPRNIDFTASHRPYVTPDRSITEVSVGNHPIFLHGESYFTSERPDIVWLYCINAASNGGQTTVCEGPALLDALSGKTRDLFTRKKIRYQMTHDGIAVRSRYPGLSRAEIHNEFVKLGTLRDIFVHQDYSVTYTFTTSAIVKTLFEGKLAFINEIVCGLDFIKRFSDNSPGIVPKGYVRFDDDTEIPKDIIEEIRLAGESCLKEINWKDGDIAIIDNNRLMHGRRGFTGQRKILSKLSRW